MKYFVYTLSNDTGFYYGMSNNIKYRIAKNEPMHKQLC